jgi:hypothetical protein
MLREELGEPSAIVLAGGIRLAMHDWVERKWGRVS